MKHDRQGASHHPELCSQVMHLTLTSTASAPTSISGFGRLTLEKGIFPRPSSCTKLAPTAGPARSPGAACRSACGANWRALRCP